MSLGVEFEEPDFMKKNYAHTNQPKGVSAYLIKNGWAHDQSSANKLLVFIAVLFVLATGIIYYLFVIKASEPADVQLPSSIVEKLSPETQAKLRASQR